MINKIDIADKNKDELFFKAARLQNLSLNTDQINVACTFLLRVKDENYLEIQNSNSKTKLPYSVVVYDGDNVENALFHKKRQAQDFIKTLKLINNLST